MAMSSEAARVEFTKMRAQISTIAQKIHELDGERNEYNLVVRALEPMDRDRKCFRLIGGVLVERTVKEVLPAIQTNLEGIDKLVKSLMEQLQMLENAAEEIRSTYNLTIEKDVAGAAQGNRKAGGSGLLV